MIISLAFLSILASATQTRPESITVVGHAWAPFISPMGEPFPPKTEFDDTLATWFRQADRNRDGVLTPLEVQGDAERFFARLDTNHDGAIDPDELVHYEWEIAPEIQVNSRLRLQRGEKPDPKRTVSQARRGEDGSSQGAARYALLDIPQPVAAADLDLNREVSIAEFRQAAISRFELLDATHRGTLSLEQLAKLRMSRLADGKAKKRKTGPDTRVGVPLPPGP